MARKHETTPIRNAIIVSDLHVGCQLGLCPIGGARLDGDGRYMPNAVQVKLWSRWMAFWEEWVPEVTKGEPYAVVLNGDAIDGCHHGSTHQWSHNLADQARAAQDILEPIVASAARFYMIRGTEAHTGKSGEEEEKLAKGLGAIKDDQGQYARNELWLRIGGKGGPLCHIMHHIGTTGSAAHEASAINAELTAMLTEAARWGHEPPDYVIRSHRHRFMDVGCDTSKGYAAALTTPAWQCKTPFAYKVAGARVSQPQWGGVLIRRGDEEHHFRRKTWSPDRAREVRL